MKLYTISFKTKQAYCAILQELRGWQVNPKKYSAKDQELSIATADNGVVDVVTETFMFHPELIVFSEKSVIKDALKEALGV